MLSRRGDKSEAPQAIWREEMNAYEDYVKGRCRALGASLPADIAERVAWADRQSLLARDYASAMSSHLARMIESASDIAG